jgi:hypothetical protein
MTDERDKTEATNNAQKAISNTEPEILESGWH